jgi:hypothetical protein
MAINPTPLPTPLPTSLPNNKRPSLNLKLEDRYKVYSTKYIKNFTGKNYAPNKKG